MKRFPGKVIMAAIILSCGFVMQAERSSEMKSRQANAEALRNTFQQDPARDSKTASLQSDRRSW